VNRSSHPVIKAAFIIDDILNNPRSRRAADDQFDTFVKNPIAIPIQLQGCQKSGAWRCHPRELVKKKNHRFVFWNRFLYTRTNILLDDVTVTPWLIITIIMFILYFSLTIYLHFKKVFRIQKRLKIVEKLFTFLKIRKILEYFKTYVLDSPQYFYEKLTINTKITITKNMLYKSIMYIQNPLIIGIALWHIPQVIIASTFIIDVICFHQLKHFLITLNLLSVYLCTRIVWFILEHHTRQNLDYCYSYLNVIKIPEKDIYHITLKDFEQFPSNGLSFNEASTQFHELINKLKLNNHLNISLREFDGARDYFNSHFSIYTSFCFTMGWIFYLLIILQLL